MKRESVAPRSQQQSATLTIRSLAPSLTPAERRVADIILADPAVVVAMSIGELATRCETSEATVVRFCQHVGFGGYPELRLALASEAGRSAAEGRKAIDLDIEVSDTLAEMVEKVAAVDAKAITDTVEALDLGALEAAIAAVRGARRIEIMGIGASGLVAQDLEQKLRRIGLVAAASVERHAALTTAALIGEDDVVIALSHSGETSDVIEPLEQASARGATCVAITNYRASSLAQAAQITLTTAAIEAVFRSGAISSRVAQLTIIDCLFIGVARLDQEATLTALDRTFLAVRGTRRDQSRGTS